MFFCVHGSAGLTHFGQLPHMRHDPVLPAEVLNSGGHGREVPPPSLHCEVCVQRQVQLLWLFWFGSLLCLLLFENNHLCESLKTKPAFVDLRVEGFKISKDGTIIFWNVRSVFQFKTFDDALPICGQMRDGLAECPCDCIHFGFRLRLNLAFFPCCDELSKFALVGKAFAV